MSLFSKLFGGGGDGSDKPAAKGAEPIDYKDYTIRPEPIPEGSKFRLAARIEKDVGGEVKSHHLIRADTLDSHGAAADAAVVKAKQVIDEQGDGIFR